MRVLSRRNKLSAIFQENFYAALISSVEKTVSRPLAQSQKFLTHFGRLLFQDCVSFPPFYTKTLGLLITLSLRFFSHTSCLTLPIQRQKIWSCCYQHFIWNPLALSLEIRPLIVSKKEEKVVMVGVITVDSLVGVVLFSFLLSYPWVSSSPSIHFSDSLTMSADWGRAVEPKKSTDDLGAWLTSSTA